MTLGDFVAAHPGWVTVLFVIVGLIAAAARGK